MCSNRMIAQTFFSWSNPIIQWLKTFKIFKPKMKLKCLLLQIKKTLVLKLILLNRYHWCKSLNRSLVKNFLNWFVLSSALRRDLVMESWSKDTQDSFLDIRKVWTNNNKRCLMIHCSWEKIKIRKKKRREMTVWIGCCLQWRKEHKNNFLIR